MKRFLAAAAGVVVAAGAHAGLLVTEASGRVEVEGRGPVGTLAEIQDGTRLTVAAGGRLVAVDLSSGREFVLGTGRYAVTGTGPRTADGRAVEAVGLPAGNLPQVRIAPGRSGQATLVMRTLRRANVPIPVSPVRTAILTETPVFRWSPVEGASRYTVSVSGRDGTPVWESATREQELALPREHRLAPGEAYSWRVEAHGDGGRISDASAGFQMATAEAIERLGRLRPEAGAPFGRRVLYAALLREAGAAEDARALWKVLAQEKPEDEVLRALAE